MGLDLNSILARSKQVMEKERSGDFKKTGVAEKINKINSGIQTFTPAVQTPILETSSAPTGFNYDEHQVLSSRLPDNIKKAMIDKKIDKPTNIVGHSFSLSDIDVNYVKSAGGTIKEEYRPSPNTQNNISYNESDIERLIEKKVNEALLKIFSESIIKENINKTLKKLISEQKMRK
jgi:hypothetical protein